ncbi:Fic family protein [Fusibacillus kribbianus]|uniref:Fic family protein n=1 Tax=Fusibacillus kribbianus TaxID=3044208 RepID=A0AAP4BBC5_9FIRM|nr:Fic family protein [Ruminococcus sp. YH-rum2234]MDI9242332.1 Fic family protein [Ruminococcus sp. YH-rum2234]
MSPYERLLNEWKKENLQTADDLAGKLDSFRVLFAYHSGKIENENVTYHDTRDIFENGKIIDYTGDIRTLFEIQNQKEAHRFILESYEERRAIDEEFIKQLHAILMKGCYDEHRWNQGERPGEYKLHDYVTGIREIGCPPEYVSEEMEELIEDIQEAVPPEKAVIGGAYLHAKFENIHPFADGNGRVGRTLMNYYFLLQGHPPVIIYEEDRKKYYAALEEFDEELKLDQMIGFLKSEAIKTHSRYLEKPLVIADIEKCGYRATDSLIKNMRKLREICGTDCTLKDVETWKCNGFPEKAGEYAERVIEELRDQEREEGLKNSYKPDEPRYEEDEWEPER